VLPLSVFKLLCKLSCRPANIGSGKDASYHGEHICSCGQQLSGVVRCDATDSSDR
jgi:hypothetical protein